MPSSKAALLAIVCITAPHIIDAAPLPGLFSFLTKGCTSGGFPANSPNTSPLHEAIAPRPAVESAVSLPNISPPRTQYSPPNSVHVPPLTWFDKAVVHQSPIHEEANEGHQQHYSHTQPNEHRRLDRQHSIVGSEGSRRFDDVFQRYNFIDDTESGTFLLPAHGDLERERDAALHTNDYLKATFFSRMDKKTQEKQPASHQARSSYASDRSGPPRDSSYSAASSSRS